MAKLTSKIIDEIVESFDRVGGSDYLDELAMRDPPTYCRLLARVLPSQIKAEIQNPSAIDLGKIMIEANARVAKMKHEP